MVSHSLTAALRETLALFDDPGTPQTTTEVADRLDLGRRSTYERLDRLVEHGQLETKKVGGNGRVWWRPPDETPSASGETPDRERPAQGRRDESNQFEPLVEAVKEYAIFTLDTEGYIQTWNPGAERIKGYETDEILGEHFSTFYTVADRETGLPEQNLSVAAAQGSVVDEGWRLRKDGSRFWATVTITAIRDDDGTLTGYAKVTRDMTDRHEYEEQLRQQRDYTRQLLETVPIGVLTVESDGQFTTANRQAAELLELEDVSDREATVGVNAVYDADGAFLPPDERPYIRAFETGESIRNWHAQIELSDGRRRWLSANVEPMTDENGDVEQVLITIENISRLKEQARRLERQRDDLEAELEAVFERVDDGFLALDADFRLTYANSHASDFLEHPEAELVGEYIWDVFELGPDVQAVFEESLETQEQTSFEQFHEPFGTWFEIHTYPSEDGLSVYFRDITERKQRERELEKSERRYRTLVENFPDGAVGLFDEGLNYIALGGQLLDQLGVDRDDRIGHRVSDIYPDDLVEEFEPYFEDTLAGEANAFETNYRDRHLSAQTLPVRNAADDVFAGMLVVQDVTERKQHERELKRQREQLAALNSLNDTVRDITDAVIHQSTRDEIEQIVCDRLVDAEYYELAWIGDVDVGSQTVKLRAEAGVTDYLDGITISVDPADERSNGPTGRALLTGTMQTARDITTDSRHDPWRDLVQSYEFRSSAAIPLVHEDTVYGVLNVYASRPYAFEGPEQRLINQLGEIVGHAIAAADRKQALMSDEVIELQFRIRDIFDGLDIESATPGTITLDHAVPVEEDEFLVYGRTTTDAVDSVKRLVEAVPHWDDVTFRTGHRKTGFQVRLSEPPVLSKVASLGGSVESAAIEEGSFEMTIHLAPSADVRQVIDTVQAAYPEAEMVKRHQHIRRETAPEDDQQVLTAGLTDRQRTALEVAVYSGYFEWPREMSGEEVADSLGIAPPTFSQHLRKAQGKVFRSLFSAQT